MQPATEATIKSLESIEWFFAVGEKVVTNNARFLTSWTEAIQSCESEYWQWLLMEAPNQYRTQLLKKSPERFRKWNDVIREVKLKTIPLVDRKIANVVQQKNLSKVFSDVVDWDILHLCVEAEYADVYPPGFFASQAYWYMKGHFPCGWDGEFPDGKLVIY